MIPIQQPKTADRDAAVIAHLAATAGSPTIAQSLFNSLPDVAKTAVYQQTRNAAIDAALSADADLNTKKIKISLIQCNGQNFTSLAGTVDPTGTATILGSAGNGIVNVQVTQTIQVHADRLKGLVQ